MNATGARRYRRQLVLFVAAILVPAAVLVGLSVRLLKNEREQAMQQSHTNARLQADEQLSSRLEAIKERERTRVFLSEPPDSRDPAVIFSATLEDDRVVMPWDIELPSKTPAFAAHFEEGRTREFGLKDRVGALAEYKASEGAAQQPWERAEARFAQARLLKDSHRLAEAAVVYEDLIKDPTTADRDGVRYRVWAAQHMLEANILSPGVDEFLRQMEGDGWFSKPELYTLRDALRAKLTSVQHRLEERIATWEQIEALAKNAASIQFQVASGTPAWVPYGKQPWLVTVAPKQGERPPLLIAVKGADVALPGMTILGDDQTGERLGAKIPVFVHLSNEWYAPATGGLPASIWLAGLALVLGVAVLGGYLLLRDVNRDMHLTEVRSQFVASVSHELKTPLTAIRMFAETLAMGRARNAESRAEYLDTIVNESERLARLVDNVLDFSKIEQGKKIYRLRSVRLDDVAESAVRTMQFPLAQQGFKLHFTSEQIPELQADPDAMQQAILNLLTNAMKYSGDSREIDLRLVRRHGDAVIEVVDRGLGLSQEEQAHVFDKFYRAPSHASLLIAGTGLGLTLVAHIADAHRGRVAVASERGVGSTFSIMIPIEART